MAPPGGGGTFAPAVRAASRALLDWSLAQYARPSNAFCHGALVLAQLLFAGMHITAASALDHIPPFSFCALRLALALPFLYWLARREGGRALRGGITTRGKPKVRSSACAHYGGNRRPAG